MIVNFIQNIHPDTTQPIHEGEILGVISELKVRYIFYSSHYRTMRKIVPKWIVLQRGSMLHIWNKFDVRSGNYSHHKAVRCSNFETSSLFRYFTNTSMFKYLHWHSTWYFVYSLIQTIKPWSRKYKGHKLDHRSICRCYSTWRTRSASITELPIKFVEKKKKKILLKVSCGMKEFERVWFLLFKLTSFEMTHEILRNLAVLLVLI